MKITDFEKELQAIDKDLTIVVNPNLPKLAGVHYMGQFIVGCPAGNIYDKRKNEYGIDLPNGAWAVHRSRLEVLDVVKATLSRMKDDPDYSDALLGKGEYSDENLGIK